MTLTKIGIEKAQSIFGFIATFFLMISFIFMGILMVLSLISNSAYKKVTRGRRINQ